MKRILIGTCAVLGVVTCSFGQGEVYFVNSAATITQMQTNNALNNPSTSPVGGTGRISAGQPGVWTFALFSAASAVNDVMTDGTTHVGTPWLDPRWQFTGAYALNTTGLGRIAPDPTRGGFTNNASLVPGFIAGETASLMVVGWNTAMGQSLNEMIAFYNLGQPGLVAGYSGVAKIILGNGASGGTTPTAPLFAATTIPGFTMSPVLVPEPTTFALAGLGAAALLIFRRRR
jgi:hypothetical protein